MTKNKNNKTYLVIGGSGLIGAEIVRDLRSLGNNVFSCDLHVSGFDPFEIKMNAEYEDDVTTVISNIFSNQNKIDGIVNLAYPRNKNYGRTLEEVSAKDFIHNVGTHLVCYYNVMKAASAILKSETCSIVNFSSIYGVIAPKFEIYQDTSMTMPVEYSASKAALIHITRYFAKYFQKTNLRFNCISPGGIHDNQDSKFLKNYELHTGNYGILEPSDLSSFVRFLLSQDSKYLNGQNLVLDDGFTL